MVSMMEPEDLDAIDRRIEQAVRIGTASAVRMQAASLRALADLSASQARTLDDLADGIEDGSVEPPGSAVKLSVVPLVEPEPEPEPEPTAELQEVEPGMFGNVPILNGPDGTALSPEMIAWLDEFDDRIKMSTFFPQAVAEAVDYGRAMDETTARIVADRTRELALNSAREESGGDA